jgi:hypothetical protein
MFCGGSSSSPASRQIGLRPEPVTNLRIRDKVFGSRGVVAQLLSQLPDKRTEILQLAAIFRSPDRRQNAGMRKRKSSVRHQEVKQLEFLRSHVDFHPRSLNQSPRSVKFDISNSNWGCIVSLGRMRAAHGSAKTRSQFPVVERLSNVIVRARV